MEHLKQFTEHLKENLSASDFEQLHQYLGIKRYRLTTLLKGQEDWYLEEIKKIATKLETDPFELMREYHIGYKYVSALDLQKIASEQGYELGFLVAAA